MTLKKIKDWIFSPSKALPQSYTKDYTETWYEMQTFRNELEEMTDSHLISEVSNLLDVFQSPRLTMVVDDYMITGTLDEEDRKELENYYVFVNMDMGIET